MDRGSRRWRIAVYLIGVLTAGGVAGAVSLSGGIEVGIVAGLALGLPLIEEADHHEAIGTGGDRLRHAGIVVVGAGVAGVVGLWAVDEFAVEGAFAVGIAAATTYGGGAAAGLANRGIGPATT